MNINDLKDKLISDYEKYGLVDIDQVVSDEQKTQIILRADDVVKGIFYFQKPWDMERCDEAFDLGDSFEEYDWNIVLNDDEEWCFMLNRMDYIEDLVLAGLIAHDDKYLICAKRLIMSWISSHRNLSYSLSTRTLDSAIRIRTWSRILSSLVANEIVDLFELCLIYNSITDQIKYLKSQWIYKYMTSNWGSIQTCSILEVLARLGFTNDDEYFVWAKDILDTQLIAQVYPDGVNWELSPMYHVEVMLYFLGTTQALKDNGLKVPINLEHTICSMTYALAHQILYKGRIDAQADSDDVDVRSVIALSAVTLYNSEFNRLAQGVDLSAFDVLAAGIKIVDLYKKMPSFEVASRYFDGSDSGVFTARNKWGEKGNSVLFLNGPLGSGHGHSDNLHVSAAFKGSPVLIDSGRYTYREDSEKRLYLKSPYAHNTLMVDNQSESIPLTSWKYSSFVTPLKTYSQHIRKTHYFEGSILDKLTNSLLCRKLFFIDKGIWVGFDEVSCSGEHEFESFFHLYPSLKANLIDSHKIAIADKLQFVSDSKLEIKQDECSREYNKLEQQDVIVATKDFESSSHSVWCMCADTCRVEKAYLLQDGKKLLDDDLYSAIRVYLTDNEWYTFVVFHHEVYEGVKAFEIDDVVFHAKSIVVHVEDGKKKYRMLRA